MGGKKHSVNDELTILGPGAFFTKHEPYPFCPLATKQPPGQKQMHK